MKNFKFALRWAFSLVFLLGLILMPDVVFSIEGGTTFAMANFITTSVTWEGKQNFEFFIRPMFVGKKPWETQGVRVIPNVQSTLKLNYFGKARKLLKAYVKGFSAGTGTVYTQRDLTVTRMKAEASEDSNDFYQTVYEQALQTGEWDDLTNTMLLQIIIDVWNRALESDYYRIFWLSDTNKESVDTAGVINGSADTDYNALTGIWQRIFANSATSPTANQIYRYQVADGAIAQVDTVTLTGTSGTCNVTVGGVAYLATFNSSLNQTHVDFVALHAAALLLRGITLTGTTTAIFTSTVPGQPTPTPVVSAFVTGDLSGGNVATTGNTAPSALASGESVTIFEDLFTNCPRVLKEVPKNNKIMLVADDVYENYIEYLEGLGTERSHLQLENGQEIYTYRGVKVIPLGWGVHLDADFPHASGELYGYPHRVIYTEFMNLVMGMDAMSEYNQTRIWYNEDEQENRFRNQIKMGTQYVHNEVMAVAY